MKNAHKSSFLNIFIKISNKIGFLKPKSQPAGPAGQLPCGQSPLRGAQPFGLQASGLFRPCGAGFLFKSAFGGTGLRPDWPSASTAPPGLGAFGSTLEACSASRFAWPEASLRSPPSRGFVRGQSPLTPGALRAPGLWPLARGRRPPASCWFYVPGGV